MVCKWRINGKILATLRMRKIFIRRIALKALKPTEVSSPMISKTTSKTEKNTTNASNKFHTLSLPNANTHSPDEYMRSDNSIANRTAKIISPASQFNFSTGFSKLSNASRTLASVCTPRYTVLATITSAESIANSFQVTKSNRLSSPLSRDQVICNLENSLVTLCNTCWLPLKLLFRLAIVFLTVPRVTELGRGAFLGASLFSES
mmetsp:Transcript_91975/g.145482  ORF Transcript_91975/g.145482 Transcript_91975/m.145482 type:complete len:205 (+) Transcript_91975:810-1424(+)